MYYVKLIVRLASDSTYFIISVGNHSIETIGNKVLIDYVCYTIHIAWDASLNLSEKHIFLISEIEHYHQ